jgi:ubiquinone/menaquinone biosynthesis C-methylase UbiE
VFAESAEFYDALYSFKDYAAEAAQVHALIEQHKRAPGRTLLDVACGTGGHLVHLREHYRVEGVDIEAGMVAAARQKHPDIPFHQGDMLDFDLGRGFDVVTCLFSSVGYVKTVPRLRQAVANMGRHVLPGGLLIVEAWLAPEDALDKSVHALLVDEPELKIARLNVSRVVEGVMILDMHYLVATPEGVEYFSELHELALFEHEDYLGAFEAAGLLVVHYDPVGWIKRGVYVGRRE